MYLTDINILRSRDNYYYRVPAMVIHHPWLRLPMNPTLAAYQGPASAHDRRDCD
jgi:hypothetical protein